MTAERSTRLKLMALACPRALDHYDAGVPYERTVYQPGIASHAVLQVIGEEEKRRALPLDERGRRRLADTVVGILTTQGREFDGDPEPPMSVDAAVQGRDIALDYLDWNEIPANSHFEIGLAVDERWRPEPYAAATFYRALLDRLTPEHYEDEEIEGDGYVVTDYKTRWGTNGSELDTVQMRGSAAIVAATYPKADFVRREVVNLRTRKTFSETTWLDDEGRAEIDGWRRDLKMQIAAAAFRGPDGRRPATPGACCVGCPYLLRCDAARAHMKGSLLADKSPVALAKGYAVTTAMLAELRGLVKAAVGEEAIEVPGGRVGYAPTEKRRAVAGAHRKVARSWHRVSDDDATWEPTNGRWLGLLDALGLGAGNVKKVAVRLHPGKGPQKMDGWREDREAFLDALLETQVAAKFGVHKDGAPDVQEEDDDDEDRLQAQARPDTH